MLYLDPPYHSINGVCVFRDHTDPLQWYAMPASPRLTTLAETVGGEERAIPQLSLIKFKGSAGTGGFVNFDVDLAIPSALRDEVAAEIKRLEDLPDTPRLANLPVVDGTVKIMLFDKETPPPPSDGGTQPPPPPPGEHLEFVLKISHAAKPSLYGDQRAAFSVQLTQEGVVTLEKALQGELSPIGIVYSLDYVGLRPAYHVSVNVDWERVQNHINEHEEFKVPLFYSSTIDKVIDELEEERLIEIKADTFITDGDDDAVIARRDEAMDDIRDMITETFFEPSLDPIDRGSGPDDEVRTVGRVLRALASGGMSEFAAFTKRAVDITRIDRKRLDVSMSERTAVRRTIYPQGHLSGLSRALEIHSLPLDHFVTEVDLDDPWFQRREVELISVTDFATDAIQSLDVELEYEGMPATALLTRETSRETVAWASVLRNGGMVREVKAHFKVTFGNVDGTERPKTLESGVISTIGDKLEIDPRSLYSIVVVPILALSFPWERYPRVEVELRYTDDANEIAQSDSLVLDEAAPETAWQMFVRNPRMTQFSYRVTYRAADQRDQVDPWVFTDAERIIVRDPFPNVRMLEVVPALDWTKVDRAFVDVNYRDDKNGIVVDESFEFTEAASTTRSLRVNLADPKRRGVSYRVTVLNKDGTVVEVPPSVTLDRRVMVRGDMKGHKVVTIRTDGAGFDAHKIRNIRIDLRYEDPAHGLSIHDSTTLLSADAAATFEYDYFAEGPTNYEFRVTTEFTNNLSRTKDWTSSEETDLVIPVG